MTKKPRSPGVKVESHVRAGGWSAQQNRKLAGVKVSSQVRAGAIGRQHNRRLVRAV